MIRSSRSAEQKRTLVRELTDVLVRTAAARPETVHVLIRDVPREHWAVAGELISDRSSG